MLNDSFIEATGDLEKFSFYEDNIFFSFSFSLPELQYNKFACLKYYISCTYVGSNTAWCGRKKLRGKSLMLPSLFGPAAANDSDVKVEEASQAAAAQSFKAHPPVAEVFLIQDLISLTLLKKSKILLTVQQTSLLFVKRLIWSLHDEWARIAAGSLKEGNFVFRKQFLPPTRTFSTCLPHCHLFTGMSNISVQLSTGVWLSCSKKDD